MKGITSDLHNKYHLISSLSVVIVILVSISFSILYLIIDFGILAISFWFILYYLIMQILFFSIFKARDALLVMRKPRHQFITKAFFNIIFILVNLLLFGIVFLFYDELYLVVIFSAILVSILYLFLYSYLQFPVKDVILDDMNKIDRAPYSWSLYGICFCVVILLLCFNEYSAYNNVPLNSVEISKEQKENVNNIETELVKLTDKESLKRGEDLYNKNCVVCHLENGAGSIGPNLTDSYSIHGGNFNSIVNVISNGVPEKGMISWAPILSFTQINEVASYLFELPEAKGKDPQGDFFIQD
ncbi:MAG: c-type cytochrome [Flavobacteriales bacterium]|jgi:mono/diheme cytochrome c family protein|nr:c-type cytochrome [Flavobacteriales bacterium]